MSSPTTSRAVLHVNVLPHSTAEAIYYPKARENRRVSPDAIVASIPPRPDYDLTFQGGHTIPNLTFSLFYIGGDASWQNQDRGNIDRAIAAAMSDRNLNNVVQQYFSQPISATFRPSTVLPDSKPTTFGQGDVEKLVSSLFTSNQLQGYDYANSVFAFVLPSGTELTDNGASIQTHEQETAVSSFNGLGGYHGSIAVNGTTLYYAVVVYAQDLGGGKQNGIVAFSDPWKNITAALYHELQEARTDADTTGTPGWISNPIGDFGNQQVEIGDTPVFEAGRNLGLVFKEVPLADGSGTVPVQLMYSNAVHGPEGPVGTPDPPASTSGGGASGGSPWGTIIIVLLVLLVVGGIVYYAFFRH